MIREEYGEIQALNLVRAQYETLIRWAEERLEKTEDQDSRRFQRRWLDHDRSILDAVVKLIHRLYAESKGKCGEGCGKTGPCVLAQGHEGFHEYE